jgi:hypothetical protein
MLSAWLQAALGLQHRMAIKSVQTSVARTEARLHARRLFRVVCCWPPAPWEPGFSRPAQLAGESPCRLDKCAQ